MKKYVPRELTLELLGSQLELEEKGNVVLDCKPSNKHGESMLK